MTPPLPHRDQPPPDPARVYDRYRGIIDDWPAFLDSLARPLPLCLWANPQRCSPGELGAILAAEGIDARPLAWHPLALRLADPSVAVGWRWWYVAGLAHCQEEVSLLPAFLLQPQAGMRVLDLCAAPGGKTALTASAMGRSGTVVANDVSVGRVRALRHTIERLGLVNVCTTGHNGINLPTAVGGFHRILVDAPCSAEGVWRKSTAFAAGCGPERSRRMARTQELLLDRAVRLCLPGGRIVYSTCTFAPEENELVVDRVLRRHPDILRLVPARIPGLVTVPGLTTWQGETLLPELAGAIRIWPHLNDSGGFFVAVLEKTGGEAVEIPGSGLTLEDGWQETLATRFGIDEAALAGLGATRQNAEGLHLVGEKLVPPVQPQPSACGVFGYRSRMRHPSLTTAGAQLLGRHARRNAVELGADQVLAYCRRQDVTLAADQAVGTIDSAMVVVRHQGHGLGMGRVTRDGTLHSLFPKGTLFNC